MVKPLKIAVVAISLSKGGAERSTAILTHMLHRLGMDVHLITLTDAISYEFSGTLFNLGKYKTKKDTIWSRWKHIRLLKKYIQQQQFDLIIDNRTRSENLKELIYLKFVYHHQKIIYVVRSFQLQNYFPKSKNLAVKMISNSVSIVGVSKAIAEEIEKKYHTKEVRHIYNPLPEFTVNTTKTDESYVLYLGRIDEKVKNFSLLLEAFKQSDLPAANIKLKIFGQGEDEQWLREKIISMHLERHVFMFPFTPHIAEVLINAHFLVLTSVYEGFPRVLLEALSLGVPVVSVDCKSGPNEVIQNEKNGLLVENHNPEALTHAFNRFLHDKGLYQRCKSNSKKSVSHLSQENIMLQWKKLIEDVTQSN